MSCEDMLLLIEKLADGEGTPSEKARAEAHMETCDACRAHFRFLEALPEAAGKASLPEPPEMYWEVLPRKVMARIEKERSASASPGWFGGLLSPARLRWLGALAAAVVAAWVGLEVWTFRQAGAPATPSVSEMEDRAASTEPVFRREIEEADQQSSPSSMPADSEADTELRQVAPAASEPSFEVEPAAPRRDRPTTQVGGPDQPPAGLAGEEVEVPEPTLSLKRAPIVVPEERREQEEGTVSKSRAAAVSLDEAAVGGREDKEDKDVAVGRVASPSAAPPPPGKESYLTPGGPSRKRRGATLQTLSTQTTSEAELQDECRAIRTFLSQNPDTEQALDARYRLALCSIRLFRSYPTDATRRQADEDSAAFLEVFSEGDRADEVRSQLELVKK